MIRIGKSVFFYFDSGLNENYILIGLLGCAAIGPMTYYFTKTQISGEKSFDPKSLWHLIPMVLLACYALFYESYGENRAFWSSKIVRGIYIYWGLYLFYSVFLVIKQRLILKQSFNEDGWTTGVLLGVLAIWIAYYTSSFTSYLTGSLTFSFLVYLLAWVLLTQRKQVIAKKKGKASVKPLNDSEKGRLEEKIQTVLLNENLFKDPNLTMPALAKLVGQTPHQFSSFINDQLGQNFSQLMSTYRIEAAKTMLIDMPHLTVEAIGFDCGFNSTSTFHTSFKKATGLTPAAFRKETSNSSTL
ncbi:helix-turn-helix domain-containing protein [Roseivirga sp.]|uniref:helix-turn-helix domain-containing protein n=1 Tax=Roseivirga sp. TaxID=1964215 RepID=UPI003B8E4494